MKNNDANSMRSTGDSTPEAQMVEAKLIGRILNAEGYYDHTIIPWRDGNTVFQKFVDQLPRGSDIPASHEPYDSECPICTEEYETARPDSEPEPAVKLPYGHMMGSDCVLHWLSNDLKKTCPLCRSSIGIPRRDIFAARALDIKHFLCWLLVAGDPWKGLEMLGHLEVYKVYYLMRLEAAAMKLEQEDTTAKIRKRRNAWYTSIYQRGRLDYARHFVAHNMHRAKSQRLSFRKWISFTTARAARQLIVDQLSDVALFEFVAPFATPRYVDEYMRDKKRGFYSSWDYTTWSQPGKKRKDFVHGFVYGWRTKFPTVVRFGNDTYTEAYAHDFTAMLSGQYGPFATTES